MAIFFSATTLPDRWMRSSARYSPAGQPVAGPWPPHQQARPDPDDEALPVAIVEPEYDGGI